MKGRSRSRLLPVAAAAVLLPSPTLAQTCPGGGEPVGWLGIAGIECNCTIDTRGVPPVWSFRSEPRILGVDPGSPAEGVLRAGDEIVAVNGDLITTSEAGRAFGALDPAVPLTLTVRRGGRLVEVRPTPAPICGGDPRAEPATPRALSRTPFMRSPARAPEPPPPATTVLPRRPSPAALQAPASAEPPPPPDLVRNGGWFGFGITCARCGWEVERGDSLPRWSFAEYPRLMGVEEDSPAWRAGLRSGDQLLRVDGVDLRTDEGGRRFGAVRPGQQVRWSFRRGASERSVDVRATERPVPPELARMATMLDTLAARTRRGERVPADFFNVWTAPPGAAPSLPRTRNPEAFRTLRFRDVIGDVEVEVLGGPGVVTTIVENGRDVIIDTGDARIRVRVRSPENPQPRRD